MATDKIIKLYSTALKCYGKHNITIFIFNVLWKTCTNIIKAKICITKQK